MDSTLLPVGIPSAIHSPIAILEKNKEEALKKTAEMAERYVDRLTSLQTKTPTKANTEPAVAVESKKSFFRKVTDWFSGILGFGKTEATETPESSLDEEIQTPSILHFIPQLSDKLEKDKKLRDGFKILNDEIKRMSEDSAEFEKQALQGFSNIEKILFDMGITQRNQKAQMRLFLHDIISSVHDENKELHQKHFNLQIETEKHEKTQSTIKTLKVGYVAASVLVLAAAYATGGVSLLFTGLSAAAGVGSGALQVTQGVNKHQADKKTGELGFVGHSRKNNSLKITDSMQTTGELDQADARLMKLLVKLAKDQHEATQSFAKMR